MCKILDPRETFLDYKWHSCEWWRPLYLRLSKGILKKCVSVLETRMRERIANNFDVVFLCERFLLNILSKDSCVNI